MYKDVRNVVGWSSVLFWLAWLIVLVIVLEINAKCCNNISREGYENIDDASRNIQQADSTKTQMPVSFKLDKKK